MLFKKKKKKLFHVLETGVFILLEADLSEGQSEGQLICHWFPQL